MEKPEIIVVALFIVSNIVTVFELKFSVAAWIRVIFVVPALTIVNVFPEILATEVSKSV